MDETRREYSADELANTLTAADTIEKQARPQDQLQKYSYRIVPLLLLTGMQPGELFKLGWATVGIDQITFPRTETKQRKLKIISVTPDIQAILDDLAKDKKDEYVLPFRRRSGTMKTGYADNLIRKIMEIAGIQNFVLNGLRHTASTKMVTEAMGRGVGAKDIMNILGHSQLKTTMKYQHADLSRMRQAMDVLSESANGHSRVDKAKTSGYT